MNSCVVSIYLNLLHDTFLLFWRLYWISWGTIVIKSGLHYQLTLSIFIEMELFAAAKSQYECHKNCSKWFLVVNFVVKYNGTFIYVHWQWSIMMFSVNWILNIEKQDDSSIKTIIYTIHDTYSKHIVQRTFQLILCMPSQPYILYL